MGDDPDDADEAGVPLTVRLVQLAGALWVGHGALFLAAGALLWYADGFGTPPLAALAALLGAMFAAAGLMTATGQADDPSGPAVGSLVLALVAALAAAAAYRPANLDAGLTAAALGGYGVSLALPGVVVLTCRRDYLAWRARRHPRSPE